MSSILTNTSAMVALQTMKGINSNLTQVQSEISTGKSVSSSKDNAAIWAISKTMESDVAGFDTIGESLSLGQSTVSVARQASETVTDLLTQMKEKIVSAQGENVDRESLQRDISSLRDQIGTVVGSAQFNGLNLVNGTSTDPMKVLASLDRSSDQKVSPNHISVDRQDLSMGTDPADGGTASGGLADIWTIDVTAAAADAASPSGAESALDTIEGLIKVATNAAASFGSSENRLSMQQDFVSKLSDAMTSGVGSLVDADMEEASARLSALQVQQQLGVQALSIANESPQNILSLFR
ncbi:flagellin [Falsirhodobacter algicola]|uniref:Flagellin n=1 Tax=Falsirhodobacter algicola TaxID=2692330 RepID=A0A8J8MSI9_9RHOB|nr:flagellin [Falsirhodobacter algicola]QUS35940.1 flagellin [Falsirhodobacter algicola]